MTRGQPYAYRDLDGTRIDAPQAAEIAGRWAVPDDVRRRSRARTAAYKRGRLTS